jgi:LuxR family maltose regulon positive regulatory protein
MAEVMFERNDLESALVHLKQGLEFIHLWGKADDLVLAHVTETRIYLALADRSAAMQAVEKMNRVIQTRGVFPEAPHAAELARVKLWLAQGDLQAAGRWAESLQERFGSRDPFSFENELTLIAQARVWIAQNRPDETLRSLSRLEEIAGSAQRIGRVIEILLLRALALRQTGDSQQSLLVLTKCLELAEPESYMRLFLDEGQTMRSLLAQWLAHASPGRLWDYAARLLSAFNSELPPQTITQEKASLPGGMAEPLSQRELEVLHLISLGKTNQEIAGQLIVALGTIKAHTASIYRKLEAANRTEAVTRARKLGILP